MTDDENSKRKKCYYAVKRGHLPGVHESWRSCSEAVLKYPNPVFKKFKTKTEADRFCAGFALSDTTLDDQSGEWQKPIQQMKTAFLKDMDDFGLKTFRLEHKGAPAKKTKVTVTTNTDSNKMQNDNFSGVVYNTWVEGSIKHGGLMAVYFSENNSMNSIHNFQWKKPLEKTRVGVAACVRAVSLVCAHLDKQKTHDVAKTTKVVIHSNTKYLVKFMNNWLRICLRTRNFNSYENGDMMNVLYAQIMTSNLRIQMVYDKASEECLKNTKLLTEHVPQTLQDYFQKSNVIAQS